MSDELNTTVIRIRVGDSVIAATGINRDRLQPGIVRRVGRQAGIAEIQLSGSGRLMAWPIEFLFSPNGEALRA